MIEDLGVTAVVIKAQVIDEQPFDEIVAEVPVEIVDRQIPAQGWKGVQQIGAHRGVAHATINALRPMRAFLLVPAILLLLLLLPLLPTLLPSLPASAHHSKESLIGAERMIEPG